VLRIGKLTDYAIVILAHLARRGRVCVSSASDVAEATGIPQPTVAKVLKQLVQGGLLVSSRGARGGYGLARDPSVVTVLDVIDAMEGPLTLTDCAHDATACADHARCGVVGHWPRILHAVRQGLAGVTVHDLASPPVVSHPAAPPRIAQGMS
jgi:FeS assembly SUF system regulator